LEVPSDDRALAGLGCPPPSGGRPRSRSAQRPGRYRPTRDGQKRRRDGRWPGEALGAELGHPALVVDEADDHEIYLQRPAVLADWLARHQLGAVAPGNSTYGS